MSEKMSLDKIIAKINKKFGEGSICRADDFPKISRIRSGSILLDMALGGGVPVGRIGELFGAESAGKTWTALLIAKQFTDAGIKTMFLDAEGGLDISLLNTFNIKKDMFEIVRAESGEDYLEIALQLVESSEPALIIVDSIPAIVPMYEVEEDFSKIKVSGNSGLMSKFMRLLANSLNSQSKNPAEGFVGSTIILINQLRDKIGVMYGDPYGTPGGRAVKHFSTWRASVRRSEWLHENEDKKKNRVGQRITAKVVKNKTFPPYRDATYTIKFPPESSLVDEVDEIVVACTSLGILDMKGSWIWYGEEKIGHGMANSIEEIRKKPELIEELREKVYLRIY